MKTIRILLFFGFILIFTLPLNASALVTQKETNKQRIVFLRHGEKLPLGLGQLNCKGWNRSFRLPGVLQLKYGLPNYIFASKPDMILEPVLLYYVRALATIAPFSSQYNMPVDTSHAFGDIDEFTNVLLNKQYHSSLIFVVWEHINLVRVVKSIFYKFNADQNKVPFWPNSDFDSLYVVDIDWNTKTLSFNVDKEHLDNQSEVCPKSWNVRNDSPHKKLSDPDKDQNLTITQTLLLIPVAETDSADHLSCKGLNRALALPALLNNLHGIVTIDRYVAPNTKLFLNPNDNRPTQQRYSAGLMTIEPAAIARTRPVFCAYDYRDHKNLIDYIVKITHQNLTLAIAWPGSELPAIVKQLYKKIGVDSNTIPTDTPDSDALWRIEIDRSGTGQIKNVKFMQINQGIVPMTSCDV